MIFFWLIFHAANLSFQSCNLLLSFTEDVRHSTTMMKTRDRILLTSVELFNKNGVVAVTTNHIAKEMGISPGNLYFHFSNKEDIVRHLFKIMCDKTYQLWDQQKDDQGLADPIDVIEKNFELFWEYRFFHREMYYLRRKDEILSTMWKKHIHKIIKLMIVMYRRWVHAGWMKDINSKDELDFIGNVLLATASNYLQIFESPDRLPVKRHVEKGKKYVVRLLVHYATGQMEEKFRQYIQAKDSPSSN